jgi:hypothetical protein
MGVWLHSPAQFTIDKVFNLSRHNNCPPPRVMYIMFVCYVSVLLHAMVSSNKIHVIK